MVLVKLEVVTAVPCRAKVLAVTVPEMGREIPSDGFIGKASE